MTKETFTRLFNDRTKNLSMEDVCKRAKICNLTYMRYKRGMSAPHKIGRETMLRLF